MTTDAKQTRAESWNSLKSLSKHFAHYTFIKYSEWDLHDTKLQKMPKWVVDTLTCHICDAQ